MSRENNLSANIALTEFVCDGCGLYGTLDGKKLCHHCRNVPRTPPMTLREKRVDEGQRILMVLFGLGLIVFAMVALLSRVGVVK